MKQFILNTYRVARYNMRIIFGGKFGYFLLAATVFFLVFATIMAFDGYVPERDIYGILSFTAILLVFYPTVFGIQSDADQRTLEIIFGIPNYRYKIWLVRLAIVLLLAFILIFPYALLSYWALISYPLMKMIMHIMALVFFVSTMGFAFSTVVKNGNATAVIMVVFGLFFLILSDELDESKWNVFLNPFRNTSMNEVVWKEIIKQNRLIMMGVSVVFLLLGLLNLQNREKFLK